MGIDYDRNEEVKHRVLSWEERNKKKLQECNREEWLEAIREIMCLTSWEAEDYLSYLIANQPERDMSKIQLHK